MTTKIYVIGQLNIDYIVPAKTLADKTSTSLHPLIGGTAFNAAKALKERDFEPIIIGKVGHDHHGDLIKQAIQQAGIGLIIKEDESKPTGCCHIVFSDQDHSCHYSKSSSDDANQLDLGFLRNAVERVSKEDTVFLAGHFLRHQDIDETKKLIEIISRQAGRIILDLVPHDIYQKITFDEFNDIVRDNASIIIAEFITLLRLIAPDSLAQAPKESDWETLFANYQAEILVVRYGAGNISKQQIRKRRPDGQIVMLEGERDTGFAKLNLEERRGFGDALSADFLSKFQPLVGL